MFSHPFSILTSFSVKDFARQDCTDFQLELFYTKNGTIATMRCAVD